MSAVEPRRYEFGSAAEDDTLIAGLRAGQVAVIVVALLLAVMTIRRATNTAGLGVALAIVGSAAVAAFWHIGGRTVEQWIPIGARWLARLVTGKTRHLSTLPLLGETDDGKPNLPPDTLTGVEILSAPISGQSGRTVGVVCDRKTGVYAAVLAVRGRSFQLADTPEKQRRLAGWGAVLAGLARASSPIHRLQWVERTVPDDGDAMGRYLARTVAVDTGHPSLASYLELVDQGGPAAPQHETFLVVSISTLKARRQVKQAGGGDSGAVAVLLREVSALRRRLPSAEVLVDGLLPPRMVAAAMRTAFDPHARIGMARRAAAADDEAGTDPANAWPLATETAWGSYRSGPVVHATYWVAHWPRTAVGADFLAPLLLGTGGMRTIALTMEPVSPLKAHRQVEQQVVKTMADEELRAKAGFTFTARRRRAQEAVSRREQELADGHADYRVAGYVTVTAQDDGELEGACGELEQAAQQSHLEVRRLYGQQDVAFTWTLPLARGLGS
ncbi:SCO6880 family protein [Salsipaludibacter albus]|uniref:SCO6880 family protein n=1 Tax=Salsipaludibacter albus TaxID=2849650 RepID=UPI001EE442B1|nr:SCO6880 family protein [Salsipaludibacter albus]MBY5161476.1 hypothetical protein [Salsipaludibacter albus]